MAAEPLSDEELHVRLASRVERDFFQGSVPRPIAHPWNVLAFSSVFNVERVGGPERRGVFVKVPKADARRARAVSSGEGDARMARAEYETLRFLQAAWPGDPHVRFITPLAFYAEYGAVVTEQVYGIDFYRAWRRDDGARRVGMGSQNIPALFEDLGRCLLGYHSTSARIHGVVEGKVEGRTILTKCRALASVLVTRGVRRSVMDTILLRLENASTFALPSRMVPTLKGLDIRNMILVGDRELALLDPGPMKRDDPTADISRLLRTMRMLYWGSVMNFLRPKPLRVYEDRFWEGYGPVEQGQSRLLRFYLVKEFLKQWVAAYESFERRGWSSAVGLGVGRSYIDPFFGSCIRSELEWLE